MTLTNGEIYNFATNLVKAFNDNSQRLPAKISFYLQKNKNLLITLAQDIDNARTDIIKAYGTPSEEDSENFSIPQDKMPEAVKELEDLFSLEQEVQIHKINIDNFPDDLTLTTEQMESIMFMID